MQTDEENDTVPELSLLPSLRHPEPFIKSTNQVDTLWTKLLQKSPLPDFPSLPQVMRRVGERQGGMRGKTMSVDLQSLDFQGRLTKLDSLINSCRRTNSISPRAERQSLKTRKLPKHLLYKDIHRILKDDWNKTKRLTQRLLTQTIR